MIFLLIIYGAVGRRFSEMFKKRQVNKGAIRKSRAVDDEDVESGGNSALEAQQLELIREMRVEQKERRRAAGVDTGTLMSASERAKQEKQRKIDEEMKGIQDQAAGPDLKALMTSQFTEQVGTAVNDDKVHEKRMEAFIDEQLGTAKDPDEAHSKPKELSAEDKLYVIEAEGLGPDTSTTAEGITG